MEHALFKTLPPSVKFGQARLRAASMSPTVIHTNVLLNLQKATCSDHKTSSRGPDTPDTVPLLTQVWLLSRSIVASQDSALC